MATGVIYYDADGALHHIGAEVVILACNGIGTPRILLNSTSPRFPHGLANSSGLVGKNLMFHPYASISGTFDEPLDGYRGPSNTIWSQQFYETDLARGFVRGYTFEITRGRGPVVTALTGMSSGAIARRTQHRHARSSAQRRQRNCGAANQLHAQRQQPADARSRDRARLRRAARCRRPRHQVRSADRGGRLAPDGHRADGQRSRTLVVNEWGRSHDVKNLFIVDGSIFVTSAGVNPTSTIQALALYVADNIKKRLVNLFD